MADEYAPASYEDYLLLRQERLGRTAVHADKLKALASSAEYAAGDPETVAEYYRIIFGTTIKRPEHLERLRAFLLYRGFGGSSKDNRRFLCRRLMWLTILCGAQAGPARAVAL